MRLIDADALKDKVRELIPNYHASVVMNLFDLIDNLVDNMPTIEALQGRKAGEWIPVSERLPEVGRNVLMSVGKGMYTAEGFLKGNGKWAQYRWSANLDNVDAWAEMPEPWKGEQL